jgi:hypothetical protein
MAPGFELVGVRFYFHCGWAIQLDPSFEAEMVAEGETLRMYNPGETREVSLSSMKLISKIDRPFIADDLLSVFPPRDFQGLHYEHENGDVRGRALWMFGETDTNPPCWVLMAVMVAEAISKAARCTVVCEKEADLPWALATWRSVVRAEPPAGSVSAFTKG